MDEAVLDRMQRDVEDILLRVRTLENIDSPRQRDMLQNIGRLQDKVSAMDTHGTSVTQVRLNNIEDDIKEIKLILQRQEDNKVADRRVVLGALISALVAVALAVVQLVAM